MSDLHVYNMGLQAGSTLSRKPETNSRASAGSMVSTPDPYRGGSGSAKPERKTALPAAAKRR